MLTAEDCRARAEELSGAAEAAGDTAAAAELHALALAWRELALVADWQDALPIGNGLSEP